MKEYNSATVLGFFINLLAFLFKPDFHTSFHPLTIAHAILPRTLSCLAVKSHHRCFGKRHQEIQLFSVILRVASTEVSLAVT